MSFPIIRKVVPVTPSDTTYITTSIHVPNVLSEAVLSPTAVTLASDTLTLASHGLANGDKVEFVTVGSVTNIAVNTAYFVVNVSVNDFKVCASFGGTAIDLTGAVTTLPTLRRTHKVVSTRTSGYFMAATGGTIFILPEAHEDTDSPTVKDGGAIQLTVTAGVLYPIKIKKVFSSGTPTSAGISCLIVEESNT